MEKELQQFRNLEIDLEEIKRATTNFNDQHCIGFGGFGKVYKGELSHSVGRGMVAIKRLDHSQDQDQGNPEFLKEICALSRYKHENLISLLGFCYQDKEAILVYQLASRGSLNRHLCSRDLTWTLRLKICLDAAKGLRHLHDPSGTHQRLIHCDVKSGNILLDDQWNAMVADFGFSTMGPANELRSTVINLAAGTRGYCDPYYAMTNTLTKESDVYSFGVVLFEVLLGRLCYTIDSNGDLDQILVPKWKEYYEHDNITDIIFKDLTTQPLYESALETFSNIAYRCLKESRDDRPTMAEVVTELNIALETQKFEVYFREEVLKCAECPPKSEDELMMLLSKGVILNDGKTYFSINEKGEHYVEISIAECLVSEFQSLSKNYNTRFAMGAFQCLQRFGDQGLNTRIKTQFLSSGITYTVNLVFKYLFPPDKYSRNNYDMKLKCKRKLLGKTTISRSDLAREREDGWWTCKLYEFKSDNQIVDLQIHIKGEYVSLNHVIGVEGIEFLPSKKAGEGIKKRSTKTTEGESSYSVIHKGFFS